LLPRESATAHHRCALARKTAFITHRRLGHGRWIGGAAARHISSVTAGVATRAAARRRATNRHLFMRASGVLI
jgi:hypothetical protein